MIYREMKQNDLDEVIRLYVDYYNGHEDSEWTVETAGRRIRQRTGIADSLSMVAEEDGRIIAFVMGYFSQYDDGIVYDLDEIVVAAEHQNRGVGARLMEEIEKKARERNAISIQLQAVADGHHEHFYGKVGYKNATNFVMKVKMLIE